MGKSEGNETQGTPGLVNQKAEIGTRKKIVKYGKKKNAKTV